MLPSDDGVYVQDC